MPNIKVQSVYCSLCSAYGKSDDGSDYLSESILPIKLFLRSLLIKKKKMVNKYDNLFICYYEYAPTEYMVKNR